MTHYDQREQEGRLDWLSLNMRDILKGRKCILFTSDPHAKFDFYMTAYTDTVKTSVGEIKTIHRPYTKYPNFQIDYWKLKHLQEEAEKDNRIPYLVVFFEDCSVVWDISDLDWESRRYTINCTANTENYQKGKKEKEETWLTIEEAIWTGTTIS